MRAYADTSFLTRVYTPMVDSGTAMAALQRLRDPLPFTPLHRLELRNAIRLRVFRGEMTGEHRRMTLLAVDSDLASGVLVHEAVPWTDAFRESEELGAKHSERLGTRSADLLHVGMAVSLKCTDFFTYDKRQASLAKAAGLKIRV